MSFIGWGRAHKVLGIAGAVTMFCLGNFKVRAEPPPEAIHAHWMQTLLPLQDDGWENIAVAADAHRQVSESQQSNRIQL
jgi:hypothetical protein